MSEVIVRKPIPNQPGYEIDTNGVIWSYWRRVGRKGGGTKSVIVSDAVVKKSTINGSGYPTVNFLRNGSRQLVHRIVLIVFVGHPPSGMVACHNDGDRSNPKLSNLRWGTMKDNNADSVRHGTRQRKLTDENVRGIREMKLTGATNKAIAKKFGVSATTVSYVVWRKTWASVV